MIKSTPISTITIGVAGVGAIGSAVCTALQDGINGLALCAISDPEPNITLPVPNVSFPQLVDMADIVIECLPPAIAPDLIHRTLDAGKNLIIISACALLSDPDILTRIRTFSGRVYVPSGALSGIDGVASLAQMGIKAARIKTTKKPQGYIGAPYIADNIIDLSAISQPERLFIGSAQEAALGFPANVNVAATLSLAGIGPENTQVEIWADPAINGNSHEIEVIGEHSTIRTQILNTPDPTNPKSSMLAAQSIIRTLRNLTEPLVVL